MALYEQIDKNTACVYGIYGHLGGGKTLTAVELMTEFLDDGHLVISNIQLAGSYKNRKRYVYVDDLNSIDWWQLQKGARRGSIDRFRVAIFIDESAEYFDQFSSGSYQAKSFLSWLRHSSKQGQFVFMIVQRPEFLNKSVRLLVNKWIVCDDLRTYKIPVIRIAIPFMSSYCWRRIFDRYGNLISRGFSIVNKYDIGQFYDTGQIINHVNEAKATGNFFDDMGYLKSHTNFYLFMVLILFYLIVW